MRIAFLTGIFSFFLSLAGVCQDTTVYEIDSAILYDRYLLYLSRDTTPPRHNYVYFNPSLLGRGAAVIGYERIISPTFAIDLSAGVTSRNYLHDAYYGTNLSFSNDWQIKGGHYGQLGIKFYIDEYNNFKAVYVNPGIIYSAYNVERRILYNGAEYDGDFSTTNKEVFLKIGYIRHIFTKALKIDMYTGIGGRDKELFEKEKLPGTLSIQKKNIKEFVVYLGFKLGVAF